MREDPVDGDAAPRVPAVPVRIRERKRAPQGEGEPDDVEHGLLGAVLRRGAAGGLLLRSVACAHELEDLRAGAHERRAQRRQGCGEVFVDGVCQDGCVVVGDDAGRGERARAVEHPRGRLVLRRAVAIRANDLEALFRELLTVAPELPHVGFPVPGAIAQVGIRDDLVRGERRVVVLKMKARLRSRCAVASSAMRSRFVGIPLTPSVHPFYPSARFRPRGDGKVQFVCDMQITCGNTTECAKERYTFLNRNRTLRIRGH